MGESERSAFEALPRFPALLRLRSWDEAAKQSGLRVEGLASYASLIRDHLLQG
jgi:hypothetical protein